jgi:CSLREA domain-containing protein
MMIRLRFIPFYFTLLALVASLLGGALTVTPARAAGILVNSNADTVANDGACTLREAITNANGNSQLYASPGECATGAGADTITFAANYTITLVDSQLPAITTEIAINGNGAANTIIQANAAANTATYRVFQVTSTGIFTLNDVTVRHGVCNGSCEGIAPNFGGGIFSEGETTINNSILSNNIATGGGGGILHSYEFSKKLTIEDSALNSNSSSNNGGAIFTNGLLEISNSTFENNSAFSGGAIAKFGAPQFTLTTSVFSLNTTTQSGGAIYFWAASNASVSDTVFSQNTAGAGMGGGIYNDANSPTITSSTFRNNIAGFGGGGVSNWNGSNPTLTNLTFSGNSAQYGGGMYNYNGSSPLLTNVTFSGNTASNTGGGMYNYWNNSSPTFTNVIIANSTSGGDCVNGSHALNPASSNNLIESTGANACGLVDGPNDNIIGEDPLLGPLADNGGSTQTHALLAGSPAIDAGTNSGAPATDQRGVTRDSAYDIGAFESQAQKGPNFTVNTAADTDDGSCDVFVSGLHDCTLREAINAANADADASDITFADDYTITLVGSQLPAITTEVTINGNGAASTIIQAHENPNTATYRVLEVDTTGTLTLDGVTVRHGRCNGSCATFASWGGGMLNRGTASLTNVTFSGNSAFIGGGMYNNGAATINTSTFSTNQTNLGDSTAHGSAILNAPAGTLTATNSTISGNLSGGFSSVMNLGTLTLMNATLYGNTANLGGGTGVSGLYNGGTLNYSNTIIANSTGTGDCSDVGTIATNSNNLVQDGTCSAGLSGDPQLGLLADNGGATQTHALLAGSRAIDTGTNTGCPATDQRGVTRDSACDIGAFEYTSAVEPGSLIVRSNGKQDGWVLESSETSNKGGTLDRTSTTLLLGDDDLNRQYRSILSFNTAAIPDGANITKVTLLVKRAGSSGGNLFNTFKGLMVDVRKGTFGKPALQLADFKGSAVGTYGPFQPVLLLDGWFTGWYEIDLTPASTRINDAGNTQLRLRFKLDDNNNFTANFLSLYSGNAGTSSRPQLIVEYGTP